MISVQRSPIVYKVGHENPSQEGPIMHRGPPIPRMIWTPDLVILLVPVQESSALGNSNSICLSMQCASVHVYFTMLLNRCTCTHWWYCVSGGTEGSRQGPSHLEQANTGTWSNDHWLLCAVQEKGNHLLHHSLKLLQMVQEKKNHKYCPFL